MDKLTDGCEININTNTSNCGGCGMACSTTNVATPSCSGGMCNGVCSAGYANWYALVSELTCSSECADEEECRLAVTTPSGPTAATSTPTPTTAIAVFAGTRAAWVQPAPLELAFLSLQMVISRLVPYPVGLSWTVPPVGARLLLLVVLSMEITLPKPVASFPMGQPLFNKPSPV